MTKKIVVETEEIQQLEGIGEQLEAAMKLGLDDMINSFKQQFRNVWAVLENKYGFSISEVKGIHEETGEVIFFTDEDDKAKYQAAVKKMNELEEKHGQR